MQPFPGESYRADFEIFSAARYLDSRHTGQPQPQTATATRRTPDGHQTDTRRTPPHATTPHQTDTTSQYTNKRTLEAHQRLVKFGQW
jgi:hypothetical protein